MFAVLRCCNWKFWRPIQKLLCHRNSSKVCQRDLECFSSLTHQKPYCQVHQYWKPHVLLINTNTYILLACGWAGLYPHYRWVFKCDLKTLLWCSSYDESALLFWPFPGHVLTISCQSQTIASPFLAISRDATGFSNITNIHFTPLSTISWQFQIISW